VLSALVTLETKQKIEILFRLEKGIFKVSISLQQIKYVYQKDEGLYL